MTCLTGLPKTFTSLLKNFFEPSNATITLSTILDNTLFARPGKRFCSNITVGNLSITAADIMGTDAYPPTPMTTSGLNLISMENDLINPLTIFTPEIIFAKRSLFINPPDGIVSNLYPCFGNILVSIPFSVPTNNTSDLLSCL